MPDEIDLFLGHCLAYAFGCHLGPYHKGSGADYIVHPLKGAERLGTWGIRRTEHPDF